MRRFSLVVFLMIMLLNKLAYSSADEPNGDLNETFEVGLGNASTAAWDPNQHIVAVGGSKGVDLFTDKLQFVVHLSATPFVRALSWSPSGAKLLVATSNSLEIWDIIQKNLYKKLSAYYGSFPSNLTWSPDSSHVASVIGDPTSPNSAYLQIWDASTGAQVIQSQKPEVALRSIDWSPDGSRILGSSAVGAAIIWDARTGIKLLSIHTAGFTDTAVWSPDSRLIAVAGMYDDVKIIDATTTVVVTTIAIKPSSVSLLRWYGHKLAGILSGESVGEVRVWDTTNNFQTLSDIANISDGVSDFIFDPTGTEGLIIGKNNQVQIWSTDNIPELLYENNAFGGYMVDASWSPDNRQLAIATSSAGVQIWDVQAQTLVHQFLETRNALRVAWSLDGTRIAGSFGDGNIRIWNSASYQLSATLESGTVGPLAWNSQGSLSFVQRNVGLVIWNGATSSKILPINISKDIQVTALAWDITNNRLAIGDKQTSVFIWNMDDDSTTSFGEGQKNEADSIAWSTDGRLLAIGGFSGSIRIWETPGQLNDTLVLSPPQRVTSLSWESNDRVTANYLDGTLAIWDIAKPKQPVEIFKQPAAAIAIFWSPDKAKLAAVGNDFTVRVFSRVMSPPTPSAISTH